jgi:hypothetical protein
MKVKISKRIKKDVVPTHGVGTLLRAIGATKPEIITEHVVTMVITLTQEEKKILQLHDLSEAPLFSYKSTLADWEIRDDPRLIALNSLPPVEFTIGDIFAEDSFSLCFHTTHEMNAYINEIETRIIPRLKQYITNAASGGDIIIEA